MARVPRKTAGKRRRYHHGDLRRALLHEAVRTIRQEGLEALTLRTAGRRLGVSRTALYRHFADKSALLAGVAREGFQKFTQDLLTAWEQGGRGWEGFEAMGQAYVRFALENPSHYRVMFGGFRDLSDKDPDLHADANASFEALVDALATLQGSGDIAAGDLLPVAHYVWATVHGVAMLAIDGQLGPDPAATTAATEFAIDHLRRAIAESR